MIELAITIRAPQGYGKTWLAERIAEEVAKWKRVKVLVIDDDERDDVVKREGGWITIGQRFGAVIRTTHLSEEEDQAVLF
jgi:CO dehydrogenase nickel-insertion accessory protein CooC1